MDKMIFSSYGSEKTRQIQDEIDQIKQQTILLALSFLFIVAVIFGLIIPHLEDYSWSLSTSILIFIFIPLIWFVSKRNFTFAGILLGVFYTFAVCSPIFWGNYIEAVVLLVIPVSLISLLFGTVYGGLVAFIFTLLIFISPGVLSQLAPSTKFFSITVIWAVVGVLWMTLRPLLTALGWYWDEYHQSQEWLNQARDYQVKLHQALDELTNANTQLKRLNTIANDLRKIADEERRIKEQFVANVSHELRTPLNMIIGYCEMILRTPESYGKNISQKLLADLQVVFRNSQHLSSLIDDILDLSQIEAGQMALIKEWIKVKEIVDAVVVAVRPLYEKKGLYLRVEVEDPSLDIYCDRTRIREVLLNLLSNAGRFTEKGGVTIKVWLENRNIFFSVCDTGPGIAEIDKGKLFQPFQQIDASIRRKHGGSGLGLSISKSFVEMHDGKMTVESEVGVGTTFTFYIPLEPKIIQPDGYARWLNPYIPYEKPIRQTTLPLVDSRPKMLVIEKGSVLKHFLGRYFPDAEVVGVADEETAYKSLSESPARMIVINETKEEKILTRLAFSQTLPYPIPTVICSIPDYTEDTRSGDVVDILIKPITQDALIGSISKLDRPIETILVVDDEPDIQNLFLRFLLSKNKNYQVLRADTAFQALHLMERKRIDLILLDLIMPEMDGFEFLKRKAVETAWQEIPVILISARDPQGQPILSKFLAVTHSGGLSAQQILNGIHSLASILIPGGFGKKTPDYIVR